MKTVILGLSLFTASILVQADVTGHSWAIKRVRERFKSARVLQATELNLLHPGVEWTCAGYSASEADFTRMDPQPLYNFKIVAPKKLAPLKVANKGLSPIRSYLIGPQGLRGDNGNNYVSYLRLAANGELIGELSFKSVHSKLPDSKAAAIVDPSRFASTYVVCSQKHDSSRHTRVVAQVKR